MNKYIKNSEYWPGLIQARISIPSPFCGLARGNPQCPSVLGLSSKSEYFDPIVIVDLIVKPNPDKPELNIDD